MERATSTPDLTRRTALKGAAGVALGAAGLIAASSAASAQATPSAGESVAQVPVLTTDGAMAVLQAALAKAQEIGVPEVITIVDAAGTVKALVRMDGSPNASLNLAMDKAFTAAAFHAPTDQFAQAVSGDPVVMASILKAPNITLLPGGVPLMSGEAVIGAIGCSGGSGEQDIEVAQAGIAALGA